MVPAGESRSAVSVPGGFDRKDADLLLLLLLLILLLMLGVV